MKTPFALKNEPISCLNLLSFLPMLGVGETFKLKSIDSAEELLTVMDDFAWNWNLFRVMVFGQLKPVFIPIS